MLSEPAQGWEDAAKNYNAKLVSLTGQFAKDMVEACNLNEEETLVDVAAGPGVVALLAAPLCKHVLATDFSPTMLELVQQSAVQRGIRNVSTKLADAAKLSEDLSGLGPFDVSASNFGVIFVFDTVVAIKQMMAVTKPGGRVLITAWGAFRESPGHTVISEAAARLSLSEKLRSRSQLYPFLDGSVDKLTELFNLAGLEEIRVEKLVHQFEATSGEQYWDRISTGSPVTVQMLSALTPNELDDVHHEVVRWLDETFPQGGISLMTTAYLASGRCPL